MPFDRDAEARIRDLEQRVRRHDTTIGTLIAWIAQSATSPLSREEAARLLRLLEGAAPEESSGRSSAG